MLNNHKLFVRKTLHKQSKQLKNKKKKCAFDYIHQMETEDEDKRPVWARNFSHGCLLPQRAVITLMGFLALICAYINRVSISFVITKLVVPMNRTDQNSGVCPPEVSDDGLGINSGSTYKCHLPGGILSDKFGAKWILGISLLLSGMCTAFTPVAIFYGAEWGLIAIRILMGAAQGPIFPALTTLLSHWVPAKERVSLGTFCYSGITAGIVISNICSGQMLHYFDWTITLITFGFTTGVWFIFFILLGTSTPYEHPCISPMEISFLAKQIPKKSDNILIPWRQILLSKALFAAIIGQIGHDCSYYAMISYLPKYMANVLQFSIRTNGIVSTFPFVAMWGSSLISGLMADWLIRTGKMSINSERKLFTFIGALFPGSFMVAASYAECNKGLVVVFITLALFTMGPYYAGQKLTPMDMSPSYSGTLMAIINGIGAVAGLISPPIIGAMTPNATLYEWRWVFWLGLVILVLSAVFFCLWGTTEMQPYDPNFSAQNAAVNTMSM
ncbi:putative inorganic phosphate cotransporter isoform X2 [Drosophila novamexicana]|uniref:putative inorganic phosphate cotransporter isoform X2 n=1 Tax=Drosophila novamexicana TaxID=47314 RepID=UPI0011E5B0D2|nr:putative inorganic phosphate cotransporter isoform X2 [Drosophila novamexicana]